MQQVTNNIFNHKRTAAIILGDKESFTMENRLFSLMCFIAMVVLAVFFVINSLQGYFTISIVVAVVFIFEAVFYYLSRFKTIYRGNIIINGLVSYAALVATYYYDSGINGPIIFLFFFTFNLLVACTPNRLQRYWLALHIITVGTIMAIEFFSPHLISYIYKSNGERVFDVFSCYIVTLVFVFVITRFLLNYYLREKIKTQDSQFKLEAFFETSQSCYILLNRQFEIIYFNHAAATFINNAYNMQLRQGEKLHHVVNIFSGKDFTTYYQKALAGMAHQGEQLIHYELLGDIYWQYSFAPVLNNRKKIIGVAFTCDDITERKQQEEKIKRHNLSLTKIAFAQSHQLRQPVSSVLGLLALIKDDNNNIEEYLPYLNEAVGELDSRLHEVIAHKNNVFN